MRYETKLTTWIAENAPGARFVYKDAWASTYRFWDNHILPLFSDVQPGYSRIKEYCEVINRRIEIVGAHRSKSILHPVLKLTYKGVTIVFRYNFYDYNVSIISPFPLSLPEDSTLFESEIASFFHEGFPDEYVLDGRYETNKASFMAYIENHYKFYTFMFLLKQEIDGKTAAKGVD